MKKATVYILGLFAFAAFVMAISCHEADFNGSGKVDMSDYAYFSTWYNSRNCTANNTWCGGCDFAHDGDVDLTDLADFGQWYGKTCYNCSDTDGGVTYSIQGTVFGLNDATPYSYSDYCLASNYLREYYCSGIHWTYTNYWCNSTNSSTCSGGRCI